MPVPEDFPQTVCRQPTMNVPEWKDMSGFMSDIPGPTWEKTGRLKRRDEAHQTVGRGSKPEFSYGLFSLQAGSARWSATPLWQRSIFTAGNGILDMEFWEFVSVNNKLFCLILNWDLKADSLYKYANYLIPTLYNNTQLSGHITIQIIYFSKVQDQYWLLQPNIYIRIHVSYWGWPNNLPPWTFIFGVQLYPICLDLKNGQWFILLRWRMGGVWYVIALDRQGNVLLLPREY